MNTVLCAALVGLTYWISMGRAFYYFSFAFRKPVVLGVVIGAIYGDVQTGLLLGAFYVVTGDIRLSAAAHITINSMGLISYALDDGSAGKATTAEALTLTLTCFIAAALLTVLWWKLTHRKQ